VIRIAHEREPAVNGGYYRVGYFQVSRVLDNKGLQEQKYCRTGQNIAAFQDLCKEFEISANSKEYIRREDSSPVISLT
jgi:hypothetical protein